LLFTHVKNVTGVVSFLSKHVPLGQILQFLHAVFLVLSRSLVAGYLRLLALFNALVVQGVELLLRPLLDSRPIQREEINLLP
jgi:hypothetical protein